MNTVETRDRMPHMLYAGKRPAGAFDLMTVIELPDQQATALKARAAAQGLTLEAWLKRLADEEGLRSGQSPPRKPQPAFSRFKSA